MYKKLLFFLLLTGAVCSLFAGPVTVERARTVATNFAYSEGLKMLLDGELADISVQSTFEEFYIFTGKNGKGFILVSKDDRVIPILAYSEENAFITKGMPENIESWLRDYDNQIQFYRDHGIEASQKTKEEWAKLEKDTPKTSGNLGPSVSPLMTTTWDQGLTDDPSYNALCPSVTTSTDIFYTYTGCVATAMAQIMKYWNWPNHGRGSNSYRCNYVFNGSTYSNELSAIFANYSFDWDNMPNELTSSSSSQQINAVATLMYAVGVSVNMEYGFSGSSAFNDSPAPSLRNYFYYNYTAALINQSDFTDREWKNMLKLELNAARPILYMGSDVSSGHAFVFDGYDANDCFHVNWGWGGLADGYYAVGSLRPYDSGAGQSSSNTYDLSNQAVIGIEPMNSLPSETGTTTVTAVPNNPQYGSVSGSGVYSNFTQDITLTATPNTNYVFKCWSDGCRSNPRTLLANGGDQTYTAIFTEMISSNQEVRYYYDATASTFHGVSSSAINEWGIRFPYSLIANANYLDEIYFPIFEGDYVLKVYRCSTPPSTSTVPVYTSSTISIRNAYSFETITLSDVVDVDHTSQDAIWVTLTSSNGYRSYIDGPAGENGNWTRNVSTGNWTQNSTNPYFIQCHFSLLPFEEPSDLSVSNISATGATVSWSPISSSSLYGYEVAYGEGLVPEAMSRISTTTNSTALSGLDNNTNYNVFVRAKYNNGYVGSEWVYTSFRTYDPTNITSPVVVTTQANEESWGTVSGSGVYQSGTQVTLTATAMPGYQFSHWEDNSTDNPRNENPVEDVTYTATFSRMGYAFTATSNDLNAGTVTVEGQDSWTEGTTTLFPYLSTVCLTATANSGYSFDHWNDGNTTNPRYCTVLESNPTYTAHFVSSGSKVSLTNHQRTVTVSVVEDATITIYDMLGRCVYRSDATPGSQNSVTLQTAGVYLVKVGNDFAEKIVLR